MTTRQYQIGGSGNRGGNPFGMIGSVIMLIVTGILIYLIFKGILTLLMWFAIPLFIIGIIMDPKGAIKTSKTLFSIAKKNPIVPMILLVLGVIFPSTVPYILLALSGGFLIAKSLLKKKVASIFGGAMPTADKEKEEVFTDYEEVVEDEDFLELPEIETHTAKKGNSSSNEYDNLFE